MIGLSEINISLRDDTGVRPRLSERKIWLTQLRPACLSSIFVLFLEFASLERLGCFDVCLYMRFILFPMIIFFLHPVISFVPVLLPVVGLGGLTVSSRSSQLRLDNIS